MQTPFQKTKNIWVNGKTGEITSSDDVILDCLQQSIILLGENHDRFDHHEWQLSVLKGILSHKNNLAVGFEMFPKRVQPILDLWTSGSINEEEFLRQSEWDKIWGFDSDLYMPLFQFCRSHNLSMIALNCERQLVRDIGKLGWEGIDKNRLENLTQAKRATSEYRRYLFDVTGGARPDRTAQSAEDQSFDRFVRAQQVWDRAFACNLAAFLQKHSETLLIGLMGSGHLDYRNGTPFQLDDLGVTNTAILLPSDDPAPSEGIADYIYCLPSLQSGSP